MLYRFFCSEKGYTVVEILVVVIILGILSAIAVPIFGAGIKKQKQNECLNQRTIISTAVKQAMYGMMDNGKRQPKIDFSRMQNNYYSIYKADDTVGNSDDEYDGKSCFVLWYTKFNPTVQMHTDTKASNQEPMSLAALRGGYRPNSDSHNPAGIDYDTGCAQGFYLKKEKYAAHNDENNNWIEATKFYEFLDNQEIPVCPFVKEKYSENKAPEHMYFIFEDGTVLCSCPDCH